MGPKEWEEVAWRYQTELALEVVTPECEERAERSKQEAPLMWNTDDKALDEAWKKPNKGGVS